MTSPVIRVMTTISHGTMPPGPNNLACAISLGNAVTAKVFSLNLIKGTACLRTSGPHSSANTGTLPVFVTKLHWYSATASKHGELF